jgi:hypothetical protein
MNFFRKKRNDSLSCTCNTKDTISLDIRQCSWILALLIVIGFFMFIFGYFKGKGSSAQEFCTIAQQEAFADNVYASACSLYQDPDGQSVQEDNPLQASECSINQDSVNQDVESQKSTDVDKDLKPLHEKKYCAQLIGFGSLRAAQSFADRISKRGLPILVKKRTSTTAKGKNIVWYQVITDWYYDIDELNVLVGKIKNVERLHDICIIACKA